MTDYPAIFSGPMVRAFLEGRKTMTRRLLYRPTKNAMSVRFLRDYSPPSALELPPNMNWTLSGWEKVRPGDRLWVREACVTIGMGHGFDVTHWPHGTCAYLADGKGEWYDRAKAAGAKSRPSIHMPRWASRLTLLVTDVRVQRLQEISSADAIAEGCPPYANSATIDCDTSNPRDDFKGLWNSIHGPDAWDANPWVAAISFRTIHANIDAIKEQP